MNNSAPQQTAVDILDELGLKKYEAATFVALARITQGTAKDINKVADVPRTRVYDAVDQLHEYGLVDIQQSNPQQFRAVPVEDAISLLRQRFDDRFAALSDTLNTLDTADESHGDPAESVWITTGTSAITNRANGFIDRADEEIVLVIDKEGRISDRMIDRLAAAMDRGVSMYIGTLSGQSYEKIESELPTAHLFESELEWLQSDGDDENESIGRLLLVDRTQLLMSWLSDHDGADEAAIWCEGGVNGLLVIARRLLAAGLDE
jgi:sugar-specific transcriptional regulator TrmB